MQQYPIMQAKQHLSRLIHQVEQGGSVELTRCGKAVVVMISEMEYRRLLQPRKSFGEKKAFSEALNAFRCKVEQEPLGIDTSVFDVDRPKESGREIVL